MSDEMITEDVYGDEIRVSRVEDHPITKESGDALICIEVSQDGFSAVGLYTPETARAIAVSLIAFADDIEFGS